MPGLAPAIHAFLHSLKTWMAGTMPGHDEDTRFEISPYCTPDQRLAKEPAGTVGCAPVSRLPLATGVA